MSLPKKYVPDSLTPKEKKAQIQSIKEKRDRPNQDKKTKRSSHTIAFQKKYGTTIMDDAFIEKNIISKKGKDIILSKVAGLITLLVVARLLVGNSGLGLDLLV